MKKSLWFALLLILVCILSLSACDNSAEQPQDPNTEQSTNQPSDSNGETIDTDDTKAPSTDNTECQHTFGEWESTKQATCSEEGELVRTCSKCSHSEKTTIAKNNLHTEVIDSAVAATCTTDGKTEGKHCSVCNTVIVAQTTVKTKGHTEVIDPAVAATCTTDGKTEGKHCSECSVILIAQQSVSKLNHNYENYICTACNDEYYTSTLIFALSEDNVSYIVSGISDNAETIVVIPSKYNNKPVSAIGYEAFNESNIKSVVFGANIKLIDAWAFRACTQLTTIVLPDNLTQIGEGAFAGCAGLSSVVMKDNVETLGKMAFYQCGNLSSINLSKKLTSIGVGAFADNVKLETIVLPDTLITIGEQAFVGCIKLKSITIPNKVETIDNYAFAQCAALKEINIGTSNLKIGSRSFMECESLVNLYIPGTVEYIDIQAFAYCTSLKEVVISNGVKSINSAAFQGCVQIEYMELPFIGHTDSQEQFLGWMFGITSSYQSNSSVVPKTLTAIKITGETIPSNAFWGCEYITELIFTSNLTSVGAAAFTGCDRISKIDFEGTIDEWCMIDFWSTPVSYTNRFYINGEIVREVYLTSATRLGVGAMSYCDDLTKISLGANITEISQYAFEECSNLEAVEMPSVKRIGSYAFYGCTKLKNLEFSNDIEFIGYAAIGKYEGLTFTTYNGIQYLGNSDNPYLVAAYITSEVTNSDTITIAMGCKVLLNSIFQYRTSLTSIDIPEGVVYIGDSAFCECSNLKTVTLPKSLMEIGQTVFQKCPLLFDVHFSGTKAEWLNIAKGNAWDQSSGIDTISCSDGNTEIDRTGWIAISSVDDLLKISSDLSGKYYLTTDIVFSDEHYSAGGILYSNNGGYGWEPIGSQNSPFRGMFDGNGYKIDGLMIESTYTYVGLFGYASYATIKNVTLTNLQVVGNASRAQYIGGLVGGMDGGSVVNCSTAGYVSSIVPSKYVISSSFTRYVGGIIGGKSGLSSPVFGKNSTQCEVSSLVYSNATKYAKVYKSSITEENKIQYTRI